MWGCGGGPGGHRTPPPPPPPPNSTAIYKIMQIYSYFIQAWRIEKHENGNSFFRWGGRAPRVSESTPDIVCFSIPALCLLVGGGVNTAWGGWYTIPAQGLFPGELVALVWKCHLACCYKQHILQPGRRCK